jgi:hypothetical protein
MARLVRHRQTKGAAPARPDLPPPRHIPTLPLGDEIRTGQFLPLRDPIADVAYEEIGHCQSKFVYFAKTSEPDFAVIDFPAFSGSI